MLKAPEPDRTLKPTAKRQLGKTDIELTQLGFGGATLGDPNVRVSSQQAEETVKAAYEAGLNYFDTAPLYGFGLSEHRLGRFLRSQPRKSFVLSTKIGRLLHRPSDPDRFKQKKWKGGLAFEMRFDYTYDGVMRSYEDSLQRLGMAQIDLLLIHDLETVIPKKDELIKQYLKQLGNGGWKALDELRSAGQIRAVGAGVNERVAINRFLEHFEIDFVLIATPYTLLEQEALNDEMVRCADRNVGLIIGAPYCNGLLTMDLQNAQQTARWSKHPHLKRARKIDDVCRRHAVPLKAAALQFPLGHPSVASVLSGPNSPEQAQDNIDMMSYNISSELWAELKDESCLCANAPTP